MNIEEKIINAVEYIKERERMHEVEDCVTCPLDIKNNGHYLPCDSFEVDYPEECVASVKKWLDRHPRKERTMADCRRIEELLVEQDKCAYCHQELVLCRNGYYYEFDNQIELAAGGRTCLYIGVDVDGNTVMRACGDDYTSDYHPKYCPECGRRLNEKGYQNEECKGF